ncbi:hypothetical protein DFH09DRAFT_1380553 [Mycena vulgaris]|nr:hypothetical protein DFH09DRAFT_1380553 [Mycena vulgaris]
MVTTASPLTCHLCTSIRLPPITGRSILPLCVFLGPCTTPIFLRIPLPSSRTMGLGAGFQNEKAAGVASSSSPRTAAIRLSTWVRVPASSFPTTSLKKATSSQSPYICSAI